MKKITAYLGLTLLFVAGVGVGIAGHSAWMKERMRRFEKRGPSMLNNSNMKRMTERLQLTDPQREQITRIFTESNEKSQATHKAHRKENAVNQRECITAIQKILTKKQREKFKEVLDQHNQKLKKEREERLQKPEGALPSKTNGANAGNAPEPSASDAKQNAANAENA